MATRSSPRRGFTIVELLVVITIITLLLALLLPSFSKARLTAQTLSCLSKMRGLTYAMTGYVGDHKETIQPGTDWQYTSGWVRANSNPNPLFYTNSAAPSTRYTCFADYSIPYLTDTNSFYCPAINGNTGTGTFQDYTHYAQNLYLSPMPTIWWGISTATDKVGNITRPSEIFSYAETSITDKKVSTVNVGWVKSFDNNWFLMPYRHGNAVGTWATAWAGSQGSANYMYVDGHGASLSGDKSGLFSCTSMGGSAAGYRSDKTADQQALWNGF